MTTGGGGGGSDGEAGVVGRDRLDFTAQGRPRPRGEAALIDNRPDLPMEAPFVVVLRGEAVCAMDPDGDLYDGRVMGWSPSVVVVLLRERVAPGVFLASAKRDVVTMYVRRATGCGMFVDNVDGRGWRVRPSQGSLLPPEQPPPPDGGSVLKIKDDLPW